MFKKATIRGEAEAFLNALFHFAVAQNKRMTISGDPDAAQDHFTMMTLHAKLRAVPYVGASWQDYSENIINTADRFRLHLKSGGYHGAPIIGSAIREIRALLQEHKPCMAQETNAYFQAMRQQRSDIL